jgi:hypothetical protein
VQFCLGPDTARLLMAISESGIAMSHCSGERTWGGSEATGPPAELVTARAVFRGGAVAPPDLKRKIFSPLIVLHSSYECKL